MTTGHAGIDRINSKFILHLGPTQMQLVEAVAALVERLKWDEVALVSHRETGQEKIDSFAMIIFNSAW